MNNKETSIKKTDELVNRAHVRSWQSMIGSAAVIWITWRKQ